jgi:ribosomal silencing factor RsfS
MMSGCTVKDGMSFDISAKQNTVDNTIVLTGEVDRIIEILRQEKLERSRSC